MITTTCAACGASAGHLGVALSTFPTERVFPCPSCEAMAQMIPHGIAGVEEVEISGLPLEEVGEEEMCRRGDDAALRITPTEGIGYASHWGQEGYRVAPVLETKPRAFWTGIWSQSLRVTPERRNPDQPLPLLAPLPGIRMARAREGEWWQDPTSGEVFTIRGGMWIWVTGTGAFPIRLPLVPILRFLQ